MNRKAETIFDAITCIREELVEEALAHRFRRRAGWRRVGSLAACMALVASLALVAALPRGCGGAGGSSGSSLNGAPPPVSSEQSPGAAPSDGPDFPAGADGREGVTILAVVREVHDGWLLAEALPGGELSAPGDRLEVPTEDVEDLPVLEAGDTVEITFTGAAQEPPGLVRLSNVTAIVLQQP